MITIPLIQKIAELFLILFVTAGLVKGHILKVEDSTVLARLSLNFVTPCVIFNSFQKELTPEVTQGLIAAVILAAVCQAVFILVAFVLKKVWHATVVERASLIFTNAGNLVIPIVSYVLGAEWVIYVSGYITVFNLLCWTYGLRMFDSQSALSFKKVVLNPNILAVIFGLVFLFLGIRLSGPIGIAFDDVAAMIGPLSMMITGIVVGSMTLKDLTANPRIWMVILFRMVICSGLVILLTILSGAAGMISSGKNIVMIVLLSAIAPSASNINQLAILYNKDAKYASAINVVSTLSCIATMPLWMMVYDALVK